ncbi:MAG: acylneuraminate cytidylyltransferase family protein [Solobacterium sp.]|nr:acylneuraminate cytidylyltransferase family protein [Solobacterium sp.]
MKNIAVIPARSGSKGLPNKNIRLLAGKPLLVYSVEAARASGLFDTVMVSTDSEEYAEIARSAGAEVPFLRSEEMSSDHAGSWEAVEEVLDNYRRLGKEFDTVTLLQPTSPLRTAEDIRNAFAIMEEKNANAVITVCETEHSPLQCDVLPKDHCMDQFVSKSARDQRRQDMDTYYRVNGAVYLVKTEYLLEDHDICRNQSYALVMDRRRSVDIDDEIDFKLAEVLLADRKERE